ncbi:MAG: hypothetical protein P8188_12545 [Gemmatimonadota bacterium]
MGSRQDPTPAQYGQLEEASELDLLESPRWLDAPGGSVDIELTLPRQGLSLLELDWRK